MAHHKDLTGTDLHEPKGIATASANTVYVATGSGSGAWTALSERTPPGMICDFTTMSAPSGWLELNGQTAAILTYPELYTAQTVQQSGTRTSASAIITGLASTSQLAAGYYVFGTGIASGTTIVSVDSGTQITLSATASSSGTSTVIVSTWLIDATNMTLPDVKTAGRYRRSRTSSTRIGNTQADQNQAHTHTGTTDNGGAHNHTGTSDAGGVDHTHTGTTGFDSASHHHSYTGPGATNGLLSGLGGTAWYSTLATNTGEEVTDHSHSFTTAGASVYSHQHTFTTSTASAHSHAFGTGSSGGTEARPLTLIVLTCVKT